MEQKRKGYKTQTQQNEANKRYRATEAGKMMQKKATAKSQAKKFIKELASLEELEELKKMIAEREGGMKMKIWGEIKNFINLSTDVNVDKDNVGKTGDCIVDIIAGKYKGFSVTGKIVFGEDEDELTIEDTAEIYNPAE